LDYGVWNTLHDGTVTGVDGGTGGDVTLRVDIAYLCEKLPTESRELDVVLHHCTHLKYIPFEGGVGLGPAELEACDLEILSGALEGGLVCVTCVKGFLWLGYESVSVRLMEGKVVSGESLLGAAREYWEQWRLKNGG
jgi:hypothetical protein